MITEYMLEVWKRDGKKHCDKCKQPVYYEVAGGHWLHLSIKDSDKVNGLYCIPEGWNMNRKDQLKYQCSNLPLDPLK